MAEKARKSLYVKQWRVGERIRRRTNNFISDYVKAKFTNVYHEALCFYDALNEMYPEKGDLRKTKEYRNWEKSVKATNSNPESLLTVQTLVTTTEMTLSEGNQNEIIRFTSQTVLNEENNDVENGTENRSEQDDTENRSEQDDTENRSEQDDTENRSKQDDTENMSEQDDTENSDEGTQTYNDNLVLEIPLQHYSPNRQPQAPPADEFYPFTDQRIREIVEELRNDPELQDIFIDPHPETTDQDEGIELPSFEEDIELDFEPFDYRLEVELENW